MAETTRTRLEQGLISLLQKKPLRHINVQDIARESGLTRQVFYRYFHTRDDLIYWIYMKDFTTAFTGKNMVSWHEMILIMMQTLKNRAYFYQRLVRHHDDNTLYRIMRAYTENLYRRIILYHTGSKPDPRTDFFLRLYTSGGVEMSIDWVRGGMNQSSEEFLEWILQAISASLREQLVGFPFRAALSPEPKQE